MRSIEVIGERAVQHIAKPLYHWRMHEESTSVNLHSKPYTRKAWVRVLADYLERSGQTAEIEMGTFFGSMRLRRPVPDDIQVAVFIRAEHGPYQLAALEKNLDRRTTVYELDESGVRAAHDPAANVILTLDEIEAEVFIFINRRLETVNQLFIEELAGHALRSDCGLVTGLSLDGAGKAIHTGFIRVPDGGVMDPYVGVDLAEVAYMRQLGITRAVEAISDEFFAVRREHILRSGGLSIMSSTGMPRLVRRLVRDARASGLSVVVTPFAIATFDETVSGLIPEPPRASRDTSVTLNPNLQAFENFMSVC